MTREEHHAMVNSLTPEERERYWDRWRYMQKLFEEMIEPDIQRARRTGEPLSPEALRCIASVQRNATLGPDTTTS